MGRHSSVLMVGTSVLSGVLLWSQSSAADPPAKRAVVALSDAGSWGRPAALLLAHRRVLETARRSLDACYEVALSEQPATAAEVDAIIRIAANGEVASVQMSSLGTVADVAVACIRHALVRLAFDAPGGSGHALHLTLLLGERAAKVRPALPLRVDSDPVVLALGPLTMRLTAAPPPPASKAVRTAVRAIEACASTHLPKAALVVDVRLLVSDTGDVARLAMSSSDPEGEPIARCTSKVTLPATRGRLSHVDVRMSVATDGKVTSAP